MDDAPVLLLHHAVSLMPALLARGDEFRMNSWRTFLELPNPVTGSSATEDPPHQGLCLPSRAPEASERGASEKAGSLLIKTR